MIFIVCLAVAMLTSVIMGKNIIGYLSNALVKQALFYRPMDFEREDTLKLR